MQKRDDGPYIDPNTHEDSLLKVIFYIENRLQKIPSLKKIDVFEELSLLSSRAQKLGLRGYHLSQISSKAYNFINKLINDDKENYSREVAISTLLSINDEIKRDCVSAFFQKDEDESIHFYVLDAYFPYREERQHLGVIARSYVQAAFLIRKTYGEFHLEDPPDLVRLDCDYLVLSQNYDNAVMCKYAGVPCPVFVGNDSCIKTQFEDFSRKFDNAKTLEEKIHAFDV